MKKQPNHNTIITDIHCRLKCYIDRILRAHVQAIRDAERIMTTTGEEIYTTKAVNDVIATIKGECSRIYVDVYVIAAIFIQW